MNPVQRPSSSSLPAPWSEEEIQLLINLADMHTSFVSANSLGKQGLWEENARRFAALSGHQRSPYVLEAKFEQYKGRKVFKEALKLRNYRSRTRRPPANWQSAPTEAERKKIHEEFNLNAPPGGSGESRRAERAHGGGEEEDS